jgi:hypothetical protein
VHASEDVLNDVVDLARRNAMRDERPQPLSNIGPGHRGCCHEQQPGAQQADDSLADD